jgi:DNA processing protein
VYPPAHTQLAHSMIEEGGGLLTEFFSRTLPDRHNFPLRNRIVAGMCDATIVIETNIKGGSMITAKIADSYNRDVFAVPGRTTDKSSTGCNYLISSQRGALLPDAKQLLQAMGWVATKKPARQQRELFVELSAEEQVIVALLREKEAVHIDDLNLGSGLQTSAVAAAVLNLELQQIVAGMPGKMYRLV